LLHKVHAPGDVPDGISLPNLSRFKLFANYKQAYDKENKPRSLLREQKKQLKDIESRIKKNEVEYQKMKTIKTFQTNRKAVQGSLKSLETEITSLQNLIELEEEHRQKELYPVCSSQKTEYLMQELVLLKANGNGLSLMLKNLAKMHCLNEKISEIGLAIESLKNQWKLAYSNDIEIPRERVSLQFILKFVLIRY